MRKFLLFFWEIAKITIIALLIIVPIRVFIFQPFFVSGASMEPNFHDLDYLIIDEITYRLGEPERGDVIVFYNPRNTSQRFIKRIIALPGETIKISQGDVYIKYSGQEEFFLLNESDYLSENVKTSGNLIIVLKEDQYFVMGDNREASYDSRNFGTLDEKHIIGRSIIKLLKGEIFN